MKQKKQILVFGASIIYGAWDKEGGWVQRLRKFIDEKNLSDPNFYCLTYNLGISGNTTKDLLNRFKFETKQRLKNKETILIFSIGVNDSIINKQGNLNYPPKKFEKNILKLIKQAKKLSSKIIFVGFNPINEAFTNPIPWDENIFYKVMLNGSLTGASFNAVDATNSAIEFDIAATAISGGFVIDNGFLTGKRDKKEAGIDRRGLLAKLFMSQNIAGNSGDILSIVCTRMAAADASCSAAFTWEEFR